MPAFLSQALDDLTRQLRFAPPVRRAADLEQAEQLYWQIDPQRNYPLDFIIYRITGYRPDTFDSTTLTGAAARHDLLVLVEQLSDSLNQAADDYDPRPYDLPALCRRLNVSSKTISRYREEGLFARRLRFHSGRRQLAFLPASVDRFLATRPHQSRAAARFSRMDESTRHEIVVRARRIANRVEVTPFRVARHLATKVGRSVEAVRQLLHESDDADPRTAIFPNRTPPLSRRQQEVIHRAYHRSVPVARLARRFGKSRSVIYRALNQRRAGALRHLKLSYAANPTFDRDDAEEVILGPGSVATEPGSATHDAPATGPGDGPAGPILSSEPMDRAQEQVLFVRYNYLKYRADRLRQAIDPHHPRSGDLDRIETFLRRAVAVKNRIVAANIRLVVSVARKHLAARTRGFDHDLAELIGEGNLVLLETVETFDPGRGNRFSTYLTWALMRRFADATRRMRPMPSLQADLGGEYWPAGLNPNVAALEHTEAVSHALGRLLEHLDDRERFIVTRHFGIGGAAEPGEPQTLAEVAAALDITPERARQVEHRALGRLRRTARQLGLELPPGTENLSHLAEENEV